MLRGDAGDRENVPSPFPTRMLTVRAEISIALIIGVAVSGFVGEMLAASRRYSRGRPYGK
jgi:hypothetical protein